MSSGKRRCVCVCVIQLLTDQTQDSGNPPLICCHGAVLSGRFREEKEQEDRVYWSLLTTALCKS